MEKEIIGKEPEKESAKEPAKRLYMGFTVTQEEKTAIKTAAQQQKLKPSAYIKQCIKRDMQTGEEEEEYYPITKAEALLHVSRSTLDKLIKKNAIPYVRIPGGSPRIPKSAIDSLKEQLSNAFPDDKSGETMISTTEAAHMFGVTTPTVIRWIEEGRLKGTKLGTRYKIRKKDALDFLENGEQ